MTDLRKKALWMSLFGFVLGIGIGVLFFFFVGGGILAQMENRLSLLLYFLLCGLFGAVNMGTAAVYGIEEWSILRSTATHFAISVSSTILFFGAIILLGWMDIPPLGVILVMLAAFLAVYFLIWLFQYLAYRRKVKTMNTKLRKWRAQRRK